MARDRLVLLINQSHTSNLGDIAIGRCMEQWIKENGWRSISLPFWDENMVFGKLAYSRMSSVVKTFSFSAKRYIIPWISNMLESIEVNTKIDCAIIGGGELFCSHRGFNASFWSWIKELQKRRIPCFVIGVSGDDNLSFILRRRNKWALRKCSLIGVRDNYSKVVFKNLYGIEAHLVPDSVFMLDVKKKRKEEPNMVICVPCLLKGNPILKSKDEIDFFQDVIKQNNKNEKHVVFISTEERDNSYTRDLCKRINQRYKTHYEFRPYPGLDEYCKMLSSVDTVISCRMHAMIIGLIYGCNIIPISFKPKLAQFDKEYGKSINIEETVIDTKAGYSRYAEIIENYLNICDSNTTHNQNS